MSDRVHTANPRTRHIKHHKPNQEFIVRDPVIDGTMSRQFKRPAPEVVPVIKVVEPMPVEDTCSLFPTETLKVQAHVIPEPKPEPEPVSESESDSVPESPPEPMPKIEPPPAEKKRAPRRIKTADPELIDGLSQAFIRGEDVRHEDPEVLAHTIVALEDKRDEMMIGGDFFESIHVQKAIDQAKEAQLKSMKKQSQQNYLGEIHQKQASTRMSLDKLKMDMREKEILMNQKSQDYIAQMKQKHERELEEHDNYWRSEVMLRRYNRTSQTLRTMRLQIQLLMRDKRFAEAEEVAKLAKARERMECQESYRLMLKDYNESKRKIESRHKEEMGIALDKVQRRRQEFKCFFDNMVRPYTTRIRILENEEVEGQDSERIWNRKHRNEGNLVEKYVGIRSTRNFIAKPSNAADFNALKLPPLPIGVPAVEEAAC